MKATWHRIELWLHSNPRVNSAVLRGGASAAQLARVEAALDVCWPDDVKAAYRVHDGMDAATESLFGAWRLLPMEAVYAAWSVQQRLPATDGVPQLGCYADLRIQPVRWHSQWVPLCANLQGDFVCLDLHPGPGGAVGQMIRYWHARAERHVLADSFAAWLSAAAAALETRSPLDPDCDWLLGREDSKHNDLIC
jgi:cell wall assembly regulator SMI1